MKKGGEIIMAKNFDAPRPGGTNQQRQEAVHPYVGDMRPQSTRRPAAAVREKGTGKFVSQKEYLDSLSA